MNKKLQEKVDSYNIEHGLWHSFFRDGNFTTCVIRREDNNAIISVGVSKRNPTDKECTERGETIAFTRAIKKL